MTIQEMDRFIFDSLAAFYPEREARNHAKWLILHFFGKNHIMRRNDEVEDALINEVRTAISRLMAYEPVQYVVGDVDFYGLVLQVTPAVLIPRPETEELVDWIGQAEKGARRIIDIGTGSGCIALGVKKALPKKEVLGLDSSEEALEVARLNARDNQVAANFEQHDILTDSLQPFTPVDVIVSNPPYVLEAERKDMSQTITKYEPEVAIFVPDDDPFVFYQVIARKAYEALEPRGHLYFEYHERYFNQVKAILEATGFRNIQLKEDMQEKKRMIRGKK